MRRWSAFGLPETRARAIAGIFEWLDPRELESVRRNVRLMERRAPRNVALALNRLSNGSLYPIIAALMLSIMGRKILPAIIIATISVVAAHLIYPLIKTRCARARPFDCDTSISSLLKPLDKHSFPSGHAMTATAAFLPLSAAVPSLSSFAVASVALIGWARLAAGHHYPSDVAAGILLGGIIAGPGVAWLLY